MLRTRYPPFAVILAILAACSGSKSGGPTGNQGGGGTFTASIDNVAFSASSVVASYASNAFTISGSQVIAGVTRSITISVPNAPVAGVYGLTIAGASATYTETTGGVTATWSCHITQGSGQVIFTALSSSRMLATFNFQAPADAGGGGTGTKVATSGHIDVRP